MLGRSALSAVLMTISFVACYDDPLEVLQPEGESRSTACCPPPPSGIFHGEESFVAGNPMLNFAGGPPYNYGYYSDGPDPGDGVIDSDAARIEVPHDTSLDSLLNFSFETWIRPSPNGDWRYGLIAMNSRVQFDQNGRNDFGHFLLDLWQHPAGSGAEPINRIDISWIVSSYERSGWSGVGVSDYDVTQAGTLGGELHVVGVHENNVVRLYINGQLVATADISGVSGLAGPGGVENTESGYRQDLSDIWLYSGQTSRPLMIGGAEYWVNEPGKYLSFGGSIGESAFYGRPLSAAEVQKHYEIGTATPPGSPDPSYEPYRDTVLVHQPAAYWRHRESELHGQLSIDGEQVVDASGNGWHGTYRGGGPTDELVVVFTLARDSVGPVMNNCFQAVEQIALLSCSGTDPAPRLDTVRLALSATYQPSGRQAAGAQLRLTAEPVPGSGGHYSITHDPRPTGTFFLASEDTDRAGGHRGEMTLTLSADGEAEAVVYRTSGVSGVEALTAEVTHEGRQATASDSITIKFPGLIEMARSGTNHSFKDQDSTTAAMRHGNTNHYVTSGNRSALLAVFSEYRLKFSSTGPFEVTEASIVWGGVLDIGTAAWGYPHQTHRRGVQVDLGLDNLPMNQRGWFEQRCKKHSLNCQYEDDHYHVFYSGN